MIGAFRGSFGGGIVFLPGTVMHVIISLYLWMSPMPAKNAAVVKSIRTRMFWIHGSVLLCGHFLPWDGRKKRRN